MILNGKKFTKSTTGIFVAEISELGLCLRPSSFTITDIPEKGQHRTFKYVETDFSNDGDVAGWHYEEMDGPNKGRLWAEGHPPHLVSILRVLIIND